MEDHVAWTEITRRHHDRSALRYASDSTDEEWEIIGPFLARASTVGRPSIHSMPILNGLQYQATAGCQWRMLPKDFPPFTIVQYHFCRWRDSGVLFVINGALVAASRIIEGRDAAPTAEIIDSQSFKTTESCGPAGYDPGKRIKGQKRHIVTDTLANLLEVVVHTADIQDRDGAPAVIESVRDSYPWVVKLFADGGYAGEKLRAAIAHIESLAIDIVKRSDSAAGFVVIARRWVVERTFAWLNRCRRLAKDWEASIASSEAWLLIASIRRSVRFVARA